MRALADPETGELIQVLDSDGVGAEPYSYETFRRAAMTVSREHRAAVNAAEGAGKALGRAEAEYHKQLAIAVGRLKSSHGSTVAETLAKGEQPVVEAKEAKDSAAAEDRAAMERVRLARDDRAALLTMGAWSRASEACE